MARLTGRRRKWGMESTPKEYNWLRLSSIGSNKFPFVYLSSAANVMKLRRRWQQMMMKGGGRGSQVVCRYITIISRGTYEREKGSHSVTSVAFVVFS